MISFQTSNFNKIRSLLRKLKIPLFSELTLLPPTPPKRADPIRSLQIVEKNIIVADFKVKSGKITFDKATYSIFEDFPSILIKGRLSFDLI